MRNLFSTTALAVVIASTALAQSATEPPAARGADAAAMAWLAAGEPGDIHVSDMIGATLYAADDGEATAGSRDAWENVGVVNDLLLTREGAVRAVLVDVGGFLGIGGKTVAAPLAAIRYIGETPDADDYDLVIMADRETLQGAPAYERPSVRVEDADMKNAMPATTAATAMPFAHEGYARADHHAMTAADLGKATVYGRGDDKIGAISDLVVGGDGKITEAIVDVGGFFGMGARSVSLPFADFTVLRQSDGDTLRVYLDTTRAKLEAMPRHEG